MILFIDTTQGNDIIIAMEEKNGRVAARERVKAKYAQAEKLLPMVDKMLAQNKLKIKDIKKIKVVNRGGSPDAAIRTSFTALRIGAVTANGLGFALRVPVEGTANGREKLKKGLKKFNVVEPIYSKEPNITLPCG
jgi:tRNA A37 threonylcarbamoyladenosine modification protein TsaB